MNALTPHVEALVYSSPSPISDQEIIKCLEEMLGTEVSREEVEASLKHLLYKYSSSEYSFQVKRIAGGYQFWGKPEFSGAVKIHLKHQNKKRLSASSLETLSIIAYKQPVTKTEIEQIRGVGCDYALQKLLEKDLAVIKGKAETIGKPILYGTGKKFMEYFGINSLKDLPLPKDFSREEAEIGGQSE